MYYLKETCVLKETELARRHAVNGVKTGATSTDRPPGDAGSKKIVDYAAFCLKKVKALQKYRLSLLKNKITYPAEITKEAVMAVTMYVLAQSTPQQREVSLERKLKQAVKDYNLFVDKKGVEEHRAKWCLQLKAEVAQMLEFHYSGVLATIYGKPVVLF